MKLFHQVLGQLSTANDIQLSSVWVSPKLFQNRKSQMTILFPSAPILEVLLLKKWTLTSLAIFQD